MGEQHDSDLFFVDDADIMPLPKGALLSSTTVLAAANGHLFWLGALHLTSSRSD